MLVILSWFLLLKRLLPGIQSRMVSSETIASITGDSTKGF